LIRYHPGEEKNTLIPKINNVQEAKKKEEKQTKIQKFPALKPFNLNIAAWDIETSNNPRTGAAACYAVLHGVINMSHGGV